MDSPVILNSDPIIAQRNLARLEHSRPRLCFVGPMVGRHPGYVTTQGEILADLFSQEGYPVLAVSTHRNRYMRLVDIVGTLIRRRHEIDIQCLQVFGGPSFVVEDIASLIGRKFGQRIIMFIHGGAMPEFMARHPRWNQRVLGRADIIVAPSEYLARVIRQYGFQARVIPNVLELQHYPFRHRRQLTPRLFWMRAFHPIWNPEMAVRVLARLKQDLPEATLVMAGQDKGMQRQIQQLVHRLGLDGAVRFVGFLDMAGKAREGDAADIFINTTRIDNMPVSVLEACAMGLPVVATAVGGIPDLLTDGETGLLVPPDDIEAMVGAIKRLLNNPDLAGRLSANGRRLAEQSDWTRVRPQWEQLFNELMSGTSREAGEDS
ncbi:MAG: glycosyltransferase family 1 protein [Acidobacteria bacterium]|nr:MAG: glycosyltransferase family 1 protein [Acidobacteriota bacterium]